MNKNQKFLKKISKKERVRVSLAIDLIIIGDMSNLDVKKLKNNDHLYRVRIGRVRIIYSKIEGLDAEILFVGPRNDNTYRDF